MHAVAFGYLGVTVFMTLSEIPHFQMTIGFGDSDLVHTASGQRGQGSFLMLYKIPVIYCRRGLNTGISLQKTECNT
jgi:hypothetical protein